MEQIWIQVILLVGVVVAIVLLTRSTADARHQAVRRVLLVVFSIVAVVSIIQPVWVTRVANLVGIGRGSDLLLYLLIIAFLSYIATSFRRLRYLERRMTVLAREMALMKAREQVPEAGDRQTG